MSTTVCNLKPGSAWTISLDVIHSQGAASLEARGTPDHPINDETVCPPPLYGKYTQDTIAESWGSVDMPANHLSEEIAAILPAPDGTSTSIPLVIAIQGQIGELPLVPRKSRTRETSDPDFELTEDDLVNLDTVAKHRPLQV